jgi:type I restriction enzyme, S subunit
LDAKTFLTEFEHLAAAPGGCDRIRELVTHLAVSGQLVASMDSAKKLSLDEVASFVMGQAPPAEECNVTGHGTIFVKTGEFGALYPEVREWTTKPLKLARDGDVLVCVVGATIGKLNLAIDCAIGRSVAAIRPSAVVATRFLYYSLMPFTLRLRRGSKGSAQGVIGKVDLSKIEIRVPTLQEQERVVAKVDELMALCDNLEAQQQRHSELRASTRRASCRELANARSAASLARAWQRVSDNVRLWVGGQDSVDDLAQAIGYLGCRGLLTGSEFPASKSDEGERPALPPGWTWKVLGDLAEYITSGSRGWREYLAPNGDVFIRSQDIKHDELRFEDRAFVALPEKAEGKRTLTRAGDLLMTITGANVGKCAQMPLLDAKAYVSQHVALIRIKDTRHTPFLHFWLTNAYGGRRHLARFIYGDKPGLNLPQVAGIPVPLPPQDVQDCIVESLGHYRALCDRLARQLDEASRLSQALAQASVAAITGFSNEEQTIMKTPKTELISPLQLGAAKPDKLEAAPLASVLARQPGAMSAKALWGASGLEIDAFYQQLKTEMANGWIAQPEIATVREVATS